MSIEYLKDVIIDRNYYNGKIIELFNKTFKIKSLYLNN